MAKQLERQGRDPVRKLLKRENVQSLLQQHGVTAEHAPERVSATTQEEVRGTCQKI